MPQWGAGLLCVYIVLGLSRTTWRKAGRLVFVVTGIVIALVMASYMSSTPTPIFTPGAGNVAASAQQTTTTPGQTSTTGEDTAGRELYVTPAALAAAQSKEQQSSSSSSSSGSDGADGQ